jgi:hypothetical protein
MTYFAIAGVDDTRLALVQSLLSVHRPGAEFEWHSSLDPIRSWREAKPLTIGPAEMRLARETGSNRNFRQLHIRLGDKATRSVETDIPIVQHRALPHELRKESVELSL